MAQLEHKYNILENGGIETAINLKTKKENKLIAFFKALKRLILGTSSDTENNDI